ncbi:CoA ester lyase [Sneathiella sp.]|uniref:HpcH/HpaI aldolase/citrate lyase family protein n=1 Tax=Sneathiella sp. TaxID=1964365 RepID=UPI003561953E
MKIIRSWLFVPGDDEHKQAKGRGNAADALILDLEDSVSDDRQDIARETVATFLKNNPDRSRQELWVRINPLDNPLSLPDLAAVMSGGPDGIVLPKVYSAAEVNTLAHYLDILEVREGLPAGSTRILSVATETAASLLTFHTYLDNVSDRLVALTWGGEDLAAALGASDNRHPVTGDYDDPFLLARTYCLATSRAIDVQPVGVVYVDYRDHEGLENECLRDRRSGFIGKIAIHPAQSEVINRAFTPTEAEIDFAKRVINIFAENPGMGTIGMDGKMLDMPHLKQARNVMALYEQITGL